MQERPDGAMNISQYRSRTFNTAGKICDTGQRECLDVIWAVPLLTPYFGGPTFAVCTDHDALKWTLSLADSIRRLGCWKLQLSELYTYVIPCAGIKRQSAEPFSRLATEGSYRKSLKEDIPHLMVSLVQPTTPNNDD